jgi:hypothetical protein
VRRVAASLAAQPAPFPNSTRLLTEGAFSAVSIFAIQYNFADYLTAIDRALDGDYGALLALTEGISALPPPNPLGDSRALRVVVSCNEYSAPFDLDHKLSKRAAEFERALAELPDDAFGWFSKQGWVDSAWEQVDFCLEYRLAELPLAAVVVEGSYSGLYKLEHVSGAWLADALARLQVRYPEVQVVFADSRRFAEEWTFRFLASAFADATDSSPTR